MHAIIAWRLVRCHRDVVRVERSHYAETLFISCMATSAPNDQAYSMIHHLDDSICNIEYFVHDFVTPWKKILSIPWNIARAMLIRE